MPRPLLRMLNQQLPDAAAPMLLIDNEPGNFGCCIYQERAIDKNMQPPNQGPVAFGNENGMLAVAADFSQSPGRFLRSGGIAELSGKPSDALSILRGRKPHGSRSRGFHNQK